MATTINNPMGDVEFIEEPEGQVYMGKYGAAKGPGSKDVSVKTGDGDMDDAVEIVGADGEKVASIPYRELFTFCVITGDGNRKPAISFEHKPDEKAKSGFNHVRIPAPTSKHPGASQCCEPNPHVCLRATCRKFGWRRRLLPNAPTASCRSLRTWKPRDWAGRATSRNHTRRDRCGGWALGTEARRQFGATAAVELLACAEAHVFVKLSCVTQSIMNHVRTSRRRNTGWFGLAWVARFN